MVQIGKSLILLLLILGLTACGSEEKLFQTYELLQPEESEDKDLAGMLKEQACGAMVRISVGNLVGSGVIFRMDQREMVILTAAHVLERVAGQERSKENAESVLEITLVDGTILSDENDKSKDEDNVWSVTLSQTSDLGIITVPMKEIPEDAFAHCRYVPTDKEAFDALTAGDIILVMGCAEEVAGNAYEGTLTDSWIYIEDYGQYMMLGRTYAESGMSGGGVFDRYGRFIGILSGADERGNLAIVPLSIILSENVVLK
ncbi:MAG: trypsin-like peptidase domain-containing protein [Lachnospiraceae bacterium]|nr:trypsin-like peptidase domain-containing protein [Lachnospiraceae bacterium]